MKSYLLIISAFIIWSTWGLAIRWLDKPAEVITFYNGLFALMIQAPALLAIGRRKSLRFKEDVPVLLALGACGLINVLTFFYALKVTTLAVALITHYTAPVFVAAIAPFILKDRMGKATLAAMAVSAAGLALVASQGIAGGGADGLKGALAGTVSGLAYAFVIILCRAYSGKHHPLKLAFFQCVVTVVALGPVALRSPDSGLTMAQVVVLIAVSLTHSTFATTLYNYGIQKVTAQEAGILGYLEPIFGITLAFIFLGETPHMLAMAGGLLVIISGIFVVMQGGGVRAAEGNG